MNPSEFKRRRRQLMGMMGPGSVAILPTANQAVRNRDVHFPFRADSDFFYLTLIIQAYLPLGKLQIERVSGIARFEQQLPRAPQIGQRP